MKNDLMVIREKFNQLKSELLSDGYNPDTVENEISDIIADDILSELGEIERYEDVKRAMINMF